VGSRAARSEKQFQVSQTPLPMEDLVDPADALPNRSSANAWEQSEADQLRGFGMTTSAEVRPETSDRSSSLISEFVGFLGESKKWWLLPLVAALVVIVLLVVLSGTGATPFIYSMD
jgi:Family of unknown function (DUF5989)